MKKNPLLLVLMLMFAAFACEDETAEPEDLKKLALIENKGLEGKWKLTEYLADPGDGSGKWQKVTEGFAHTIEFRADGTFKEVKGEAMSSVPLFNAYKILDDKRIEMIPIDKNAPSHIWYYSELTPGTLTLGYGCIEACSGKYVAIQ